jgi:hypothetical protein
MRAVARPKYFSRILDTSNSHPNRNGEKLYENVIKVFKSVVVGSDVEIKFYIDYFNAPCEEVMSLDSVQHGVM